MNCIDWNNCQILVTHYLFEKNPLKLEDCVKQTNRQIMYNLFKINNINEFSLLINSRLYKSIKFLAISESLMIIEYHQ